MYRRKFSFMGLIAGLLAFIMVTLAVLACIPQTREYMADFATRFSPKHQEVLDANAELTNQNKELSEELSDKNQAIEELNSTLETKNQLLAEKDTLIANKDEEIASKTSQINTLSTQKTTLLSVVTEIDNKINSTTDEVELEELETKKANILAQIDDLNSQIATLEAEKSQLESEIATLQNEKAQLESEIATLKAEKAQLQSQVEALENSTGISLDYQYYQIGNFCLRTNRLGEKIPFSSTLSSLLYLDGGIDVFLSSRLNLNYDGVDLSAIATNSYFFLPDCDMLFYMDNTPLIDWQNYLNSTYDFEEYINFYLTFSFVNDKYTLKIELITEPFLTGQYINTGGFLIDFDCLQNSTFESPFKFDTFRLVYEYSSDIFGIFFDNNGYSFEIIDDTTIIVGGETYTKVEAEPEQTTALTWQLDYFNSSPVFSTTINFTSNSQNFVKFELYDIGYIEAMGGNLSRMRFWTVEENYIVIGETCGELKEGYTIVTFEEAPTGELLEFLQEHATPIND